MGQTEGNIWKYNITPCKLKYKKARTLNIGSFDAAKAKEKYQEVMPICKKEECRKTGYTSDRSAHAPQEGEAFPCDWRC